MNKHGIDLGLRYSDLDERLFGFTRLGTVQADEDTIFKRLHTDEGTRRDILYLRFCHRFVRTIIGSVIHTASRANRKVRRGAELN
jgi:hypothetical protein